MPLNIAGSHLTHYYGALFSFLIANPHLNLHTSPINSDLANIVSIGLVIA
jgi:hypothetical protein